uniref:Uncharacterized protein n=1 Tax=Arundo donax TaxID=35708 RepID=A0A0A8YIQ5_ARUDO
MAETRIKYISPEKLVLGHLSRFVSWFPLHNSKPELVSVQL